MVEKSGTMFVTGPDVVKTVLGEEISFEDLGGAMTHGSKRCCTLLQKMNMTAWITLENYFHFYHKIILKTHHQLKVMIQPN